MYQTIQQLLILPVLLTLSSLCNANNISTCVDVECPTRSSGLAACTVANQTFSHIGITTYSVPVIEGGLDLSWTVAMEDHINPDGSKRRQLDRVFYLGTPSSVNLTSEDLDYAGCGFYITRPNNNNVFYEPKNMNSLSSICQSQLGSTCILDLGARAVSATAKYSATSPKTSICSMIASSLQSSFPSSCSSLSEPQIHGLSLTGPNAAKPISKSENSTSNCYPTLPKSNELARVASYKLSASLYANETVPAVLGETPILSLFWKIGGENKSMILEPNVRLDCLFVRGMTTASVESMSSGSAGENGKGTANTRFGSGFGVLTFVAISAVGFVAGLV